MYEKINKIVEGALKGQEEACLALMEATEPLVMSQIKAILPYYPDWEDLKSDCRLVLLDALKTFDPSRGAQFLGYYKAQVRYYLLDFLKKEVRREETSLDAPLEGGGTLMDYLEDPARLEDSYLRTEEEEALLVALEGLTKREEEVVRLFYFGDLGLSEIAGFLGLSYQTVANTKARALKKLRKVLEGQGYGQERKRR